jgi:phosphatidylserine decarboxylase
VIRYFNRNTKKLETETVYGGDFVNWAYQTKVGYFLTRSLFSKRWLSVLMGAYEDSKISISQIAPFIKSYGINMNEFVASDYQSFNDFFIRKFVPGARPFTGGETTLSAGAEARYLAFENLEATQTFAVKGFHIDLAELFKSEEIAMRFLGGTLIIARLCPVDYHRFHFPVSGEVSKHYRVPGALHSVNPVVFKSVPEVFFANEREIAILETENFGSVAMIEVGALGVGKIVQSAYSNRSALPYKFDKGQEKGYFLFGGSTVIWLIEKGKLTLSPDLIEYSAQGIETWLPLGSPLGESRKS